MNVEVEGNAKTKILSLFNQCMNKLKILVLAFPSTSTFTLKSRTPYTYVGGQHACTSNIGILVHSLIFG